MLSQLCQNTRLGNIWYLNGFCKTHALEVAGALSALPKHTPWKLLVLKRLCQNTHLGSRWCLVSFAKTHAGHRQSLHIYSHLRTLASFLPLCSAVCLAFFLSQKSGPLPLLSVGRTPTAESSDKSPLKLSLVGYISAVCLVHTIRNRNIPVK